MNNNGSGAGIVLITPEGHHLMSAIHFKFYATNNDAEYEALINGLKLALEIGAVNLMVSAERPSERFRISCEPGQRRLESVLREENSNADALAKMGSQMDNVQLGQIPLGIQEIPSIPEVEVFQMQEIPQESWMTPIHNYIQTGAVPEDKLQARRLRYQAAKYVEYDGVLYKRGFNQPLLRCVDMKEGIIFSERLVIIASDPPTISTPWHPPLPRWFGIPYKLISDNGKQFDSKELRKLCEDLKIKKDFVAVYHQQSNGQTEAINKIIKHTLKAKLEEKKGDWPEEMPMVLWSYNTTPRSTTGETLFLLTYGYEAMVPVEVGAGSLRRDVFVEEDAEVNQRLHLDLLDEARTNSQLKLAAYQQRVARYFNKKVKFVPFKVGDLVLRKVMPNTKIAQHGVLGANWEGPYKVKAILWKGTYRLEDLDGKLIPQAWNTKHLRKYYQ
ncbi:uncharacterized protein LOC141680323 [Apium graveolens]|uniref:uncharacterized protein LOC141680323 n=1 Tax=Apium graveolens TaxID=4045 RepID=UPI003D79402A